MRTGASADLRRHYCYMLRSYPSQFTLRELATSRHPLWQAARCNRRSSEPRAANEMRWMKWNSTRPDAASETAQNVACAGHNVASFARRSNDGSGHGKQGTAVSTGRLCGNYLRQSIVARIRGRLPARPVDGAQVHLVLILGRESHRAFSASQLEGEQVDRAGRDSAYRDGTCSFVPKERRGA